MRRMSFSNRIRELSRLSRAHPLAVESDFESVKWTFPFLASVANVAPHYRTLIPNQTNTAMSFWFRVLDPSQTNDIGLGMMAQGSTQLAFGLSLSKTGSNYDLMLEYNNGALQTKQYDQFNFGDGQWHWVAITLNNEAFTVFIDGWMDITLSGISIPNTEAFHLGHSTVAGVDCYATGIEFCDIRVHSDPTTAFNFSEYWNRPTPASFGGTTWQSKSSTELVSTPAGSNLLWAGILDYDARLKTGFAISNLRGYLNGFKLAYPSAGTSTPGLHPIGRNIAYNAGVSQSGLIDVRNLEVPSIAKTISASGNALSIPTSEQGIMDSTAHLLRETNLLQNGFVRRAY